MTSDVHEQRTDAKRFSRSACTSSVRRRRDQHVEVVRFGEILVQRAKQHFTLHLQTAGPTALRQFVLIDSIVAEPTQRIMDVKYMPHHQFVHGMEHILPDRVKLNITLDRHLLLQHATILP
jgi:hypothetical protein